MPKSNDLKIFIQLLDNSVQTESVVLHTAEEDSVDFKPDVAGSSQCADMERTPVNHPDYFLFMLGTDTIYTHLPTPKFYENGETLSYTARVLAERLGEKPVIQVDKPLAFSTPSIDVVNGPTTLGYEVGERIAQGTFLILRALAEGKTRIQISGHSRAAVVSILIAHELERIKAALKANTKTLYQILTDSPCSYTQKAFAKLFKEVNESGAVRNILEQRLAHAELNMFLMDPVPGGRYMRIPGIAWRDKRFYIKPPCSDAELLIFRDETTCCFKPVIPSGITPVVIPGHHGTASGNIYTQQFLPVTISGDNKDTCTVQRLVLSKLLIFINKKTGLFDGHIDAIHLEHPELDKTTNDFLNKNQSERFTLLLDLYNKVHENDEAFKYFSSTSYAYLGSERSLSGSRLVHYGEESTIGLDTVVASLEGPYVNIEHAFIFLLLLMGLTLDGDNIAPDMMITHFSIFLKNIFQGYQDNNPKIKALFAKDDNRKITFHALSLFVDTISQKYLRNHLTVEVKTKLLEEIDKTFSVLLGYKTLNSEDPINNFIDECDKLLRLGIKNTSNAHYNSLKDQTAKLDSQFDLYLASKYHFADTIQTFLKVLDEHRSDDQEVNAHLLRIKDALSRLQHESPDMVKEALTAEMSSLANQKSDSASKAIDVLNPLLIDNTFGLEVYLNAAELEESIFFTDLNRVYENLSSFLDGREHIQQLIGNERLEFNAKTLIIHQDTIVKLAALMVVEKKTDLHIRPQNMSEDFFEKVKKQAIALGADNPEFMDLQEEHRALKQRYVDLGLIKDKALGKLRAAREQFDREKLVLQNTLKEKLQEATNDHEQSKADLNKIISSLQQKQAFLQEKIEIIIPQLKLEAQVAAEQYSSSLARQQEAADAELKATSVRLNQEKELLKKELELRIEAAIKNRDQNKAELSDKIGSMHQRLSLLQNRIDLITAQLHEKDSLKRELEEKVDAACMERDQYKESLGKKISNLQQQLASLTQKQEPDHTAADQHIKKLVAQQKSAQEQLKKIIEEKDRLEKELLQKLDIAVSDHKENKEKLEAEIGQLQEQVKVITNKYNLLLQSLTHDAHGSERVIEQLTHDKQNQAELIEQLQSKKELTCALFIENKLIPLAHEYCTYLESVARRMNPHLDSIPGGSLISGTETETPAYKKLMVKYEAVQALLMDLTDKNTIPLPSNRIIQYVNSLKSTNAQLKEHRDSGWIHFFKATLLAISIVCSGIIPGLFMLLSYAADNGHSILFFAQSEGEKFVNKVDSTLADLYDDIPDVLSAKPEISASLPEAAVTPLLV